MTDKSPENDFGGTGVSWPADVGAALPSTKGPAEFGVAAVDQGLAWVDTEHPTDDPEVFARLARQMSPGIG